MKRKIFTLAVLASLFICANARAITAGHTMLQNPDEAAKNPAVQNPDHGKGDPIPTGPDAPTSENSRKQNQAWFYRMALDEYKKSAHPDPKVTALLQKIIDFLCFPAVGPVRGELEAQANELEKAGASSPIFQMLSGMVQIDLAHQKDLFTKSLAALQENGSPKYLQFLVASELAKKLTELKAGVEEQHARDEAALMVLRDSLAADSFKEDEMPVLVWQFTEVAGPSNLFRRHAAEVCAILEDSPKVKPWVTEYFEGRRYIDEAWKERGTGWSDEVTADGWKGFNAGIAEARKHLVKSWQLNPKSPIAAATMIVVATAENEEIDTMRKWFDRAIAAEMDCADAYGQMLWGLAPKWLGTHEEMIRFGEECMKTGRYDTLVPFNYLIAVTAVAGEDDNGGKLLDDPQVYKNIQAVLSSYLAQKNGPIRAMFLHTAAAFMYYRAGKLDEAKQHLEAIDYKAAKAPEFAQFGNIPEMVEKLRAYKPTAAGASGENGQ